MDVTHQKQLSTAQQREEEGSPKTERLNELWLGEIQPLESYLAGSLQHKRLLRQLSASRQQIERLLPEESSALLRDYEAAAHELDAFCQAEAFKYGFRLAAELLRE